MFLTVFWNSSVCFDPNLNFNGFFHVILDPRGLTLHEHWNIKREKERIIGERFFESQTASRLKLGTTVVRLLKP